ncbi:hypothetical protein [Xaviernesmea oryzae]|uniref:hypothetical protein n=1 Tax=Xaviernesmea oryzae TaxID=464029 RepID=UPI001F1CFB6C|nr:hypothetical protein [Xaviernesmea oryzae]
MIDEVASPLKLVRHTTVSITGQLILDVLDKSHEFSIVEMQRPCRGSVAERASWEVDHFARSSDGVGRGPVTMEDFSLPSAIGWRSVFHQVQFRRELATLRSSAAICASYSAMTLAFASSSFSSPDRTASATTE